MCLVKATLHHDVLFDVYLEIWLFMCITFYMKMCWKPSVLCFVAFDVAKNGEGFQVYHVTHAALPSISQYVPYSYWETFVRSLVAFP